MRASALLGDIAAQSLRPLMAHCHLGLGALYRRAGKRQEAREHITTAVTMFGEMDMRYWRGRVETETDDAGDVDVAAASLTRRGTVKVPAGILRLAPPRPPTRRPRLGHGFFNTIMSVPLIVSVVPSLSHRRMICSTASLSWRGSQT